MPTLAGTVRLHGAHLTALLLVSTLVLGVTAWWAVRGSSTTVVPAARTSASPMPSSLGTAAPVTASAEGSPVSGAKTGSVVVDVAGKVRRPGIATLPVGSRVIDALRQAGGAGRGVDLTSLNLARVLVDGEQILVGVPSVSAVGAPAASSGGDAPAGTVNLNTATAEGLEELPGVGPVTAQKIVEWRTEHGAFRAVEDLLEVDGIGPKTLANLAPHASL